MNNAELTVLCPIENDAVFSSQAPHPARITGGSPSILGPMKGNLMFKTKNDIPEATRAKVVELLNARLADCIDLQTQSKQAHWNVKGPDFIALHELFDKVNEAVEDYVDDIAERAVQLGGVAEGTARMAAKRSSLPEYPAKTLDGRSHVEVLSSALRRSGQGRERASTKPTTWATRTRPTFSRRSRAASTSGCGSSRLNCRPSDSQEYRL